MKKFWIIFSICVLLIAGVVCYVKFYGSSDTQKKSRPEQIVSVRTVEASAYTLKDYVNAGAEIECESSVDVYPDIGGKIAKVNVSLGSSVRRGQTIAEVDPSEPGSYFINSKVYAPVSGTILSIPKERGVKVSTSTPITTIGDVSKIQLRGKIPERYVACLKKGLKAKVTLEAFPGKVYDATVQKVSPVVDPLSRTKEVILTFDEKHSEINAGMFAQIKLYTVDYSDKIVLPENSVVDKNGTLVVYCVKDGVAEQKEVVLGNSVDQMVQIVEGIEEGERIIVEGMTAVSNGAKVKDISEGEQ